ELSRVRRQFVQPILLLQNYEPNRLWRNVRTSQYRRQLLQAAQIVMATSMGSTLLNHYVRYICETNGIFADHRRLGRLYKGGPDHVRCTRPTGLGRLRGHISATRAEKTAFDSPRRRTRPTSRSRLLSCG